MWKYLATDAFSELETYEKFLDDWVYGVEDRTEYIEQYVKRFGYERLEKLKPESYYSTPVNYGYYSGEIF